MSVIEINKYKKKIKVQLVNGTILVKGPLGSINLNIPCVASGAKLNSFFINKKFSYHFFSKLKTTFKGLSTG